MQHILEYQTQVVPLQGVGRLSTSQIPSIRTNQYAENGVFRTSFEHRIVLATLKRETTEIGLLIKRKNIQHVVCHATL